MTRLQGEFLRDHFVQLLRELDPAIALDSRFESAFAAKLADFTHRYGTDQASLADLKREMLDWLSARRPLLRSLSNLRPLHDRVVIRRTLEERRYGAIVLPDSAREKPVRGEVLAVGTGKVLQNGEIRPLDLKRGDKVVFGKYSGTEVKIDGEDLIVMREDDVMGVVE